MTVELWLGLTVFGLVFALGLIAYLWHRGTIKLDKEKAAAMKDNVLENAKDWRDHLGRK